MQSPPPPPPPPPLPPLHPSNIEDGGHNTERPKSAGLSFCLSVSHNLTQVCLGGVVVSALIIPYRSNVSNSFVQHIILCTVGYFVLMAQAVLSFSPFGCASHLKYKNKRLIHAIMQVMGSGLAIAGSIIRMIDVEPNFETGHGICGFIAMLFTFCSFVGGALNLIFPKMNKCMKILHSLIGAVTLTFAFIAIIYAFHDYYRLEMDDRNANLAIVLSVFALVGTILMSMVRIARRLLNV